MLSMHDVVFADAAEVAANASQLARQPYSTGQLTITGSPSGGAVVLDAAMRADLLPQFAAGATLHLTNFTMVKVLCPYSLLGMGGA
jgi:hypothetical protein